MRVINLVDRLDRVNFGIWNAAIATVAELEKRHGVQSEVWFPEATNEAGGDELNGALPRPLEDLGQGALSRATAEAGLDPNLDMIVSHGCWQYATRWGRALQSRGFKWVAVPHGMLETWSLSQKRLRKWLYFRLAERRLLRRADRIRAVGQPEFETLQSTFGRQVVWIPNGVPSMPGALDLSTKPEGRNFLFMARLHHKKGVLPLVRAWLASSLAGREDCRLRIAGPDDGELEALRGLLNGKDRAGNIEYLGGVYGEGKQRLLHQSHFYILPSFSEGFPTSVLEAMQRGLVPIITKGCNFPDVFRQSLGIEITPDPEEVRHGLETAIGLSDGDWSNLSRRSHELIESRYTHERLADEQFELYQSLLGENQ